MSATSMVQGRAKLVLILALILIALLLLWLLRPAPFNPWQPTTVEYTADCGADCVEVEPNKAGETGRGHGSAVEFQYNPKVDDAVAQWSDCIADVIACIDSDKALPNCVDTARCPTPCKTRFTEAATGAADTEAQLDAFEAVFIDESADCRPSSEDAS